MAAWPSALPPLALLEGSFEASQGVVLRSEVDSGPPKTRPQYTAEIVRFSHPLVLTTAEVEILETFYWTTLNRGVDEFDWTHQRKLTTVSVSFLARPTYTPIGAGYWRTSLELEMLP